MDREFEQLALPFTPATDWSLGSYLISKANAQAVEVLKQGLSSEEGLPLMLIYGEQSCGKSHLGKAIAEAKGGIVCFAKDFPKQIERQQSDLWVLDEIDQSLHDKEILQTITSWINARRQDRAGYMVLLSRLSPKQWQETTILPDFASRLLGTPYIAEIQTPDDLLLAGVIQKLAADRHFSLSDAVMEYTLRRIPRSFAMCEAFIHAIDKQSLSSLQKPSRAIAKQALEQLGLYD